MRLRPAPLAIALALVLLALPPAPAAQQAGAPGAAPPLPPATPIQDLKSLAGKWEGRIMPRPGGPNPEPGSSAPTDPSIWIPSGIGGCSSSARGSSGTGT